MINSVVSQTKGRTLDSAPLDLSERDFIRGEIVEFDGARRFVRCNLPGVLKRPAILQVGRNPPVGPESVAVGEVATVSNVKL